jgi:hypothetical protein
MGFWSSRWASPIGLATGQNDFSGNGSCCLGRRKQRAQVVRHQHARQFFGVQAGLYIDFWPRTRSAKVEAGDGFLAAQTR